MSKNKKRKNRLIRKSKHRETYPLFLIICEGKKTEVNYFKKFKLRTKQKVIGLGKNGLKLITETQRIKKSQEKNGLKFDHIYCVFDKDTVSNKQINDAINLANKLGFKVAFSNICFELWVLLHFEDCGPHTKNDLINRLNNDFNNKYNCNYIKNDNNLYNRLEYFQKNAINRAKKMLLKYKVEFDKNPAKCNPITTVHLLVNLLNKFSIN